MVPPLNPFSIRSLWIEKWITNLPANHAQPPRPSSSSGARKRRLGAASLAPKWPRQKRRSRPRSTTTACRTPAAQRRRGAAVPSWGLCACACACLFVVQGAEAGRRAPAAKEPSSSSPLLYSSGCPTARTEACATLSYCPRLPTCGVAGSHAVDPVPGAPARLHAARGPAPEPGSRVGQVRRQAAGAGSSRSRHCPKLAYGSWRQQSGTAEKNRESCQQL